MQSSEEWLSHGFGLQMLCVCVCVGKIFVVGFLEDVVVVVLRYHPTRHIGEI